MSRKPKCNKKRNIEADWFSNHYPTGNAVLTVTVTWYLNINVERAVDEHYDLYEMEEFDLVIAGAKLMARDVKLLIRDNE